MSILEVLIEVKFDICVIMLLTFIQPLCEIPARNLHAKEAGLLTTVIISFTKKYIQNQGVGLMADNIKAIILSGKK